MKTVRRNAFKKIAGILGSIKEVKMYSFDNNFSGEVVNVDMEHITSEIAKGHCSLIDNENGKYTLNFHSNLWYYLFVNETAPTKEETTVTKQVEEENVVTLTEQTEEQAAEKVEVEQIEFLWSESPIVADNTIVKTFAEAESILFRIAANKGTEGYDKTKFTITWKDGQTYTGRVDVLKSYTYKKAILKDHIESHCLYYAGMKKAAHQTQEDYENILRAYGVSGEEQKEYKEFLETYSLEDIEPKQPESIPTNETQEEQTTEQPLQVPENVVEASYTLNEEKQGIEVSFTSKPSEEVREQLKMNGFRWSRYQKVWYAKQTSERLAFIQLLTGVQEGEELGNNTPAPTFDNSLPEIDIDDIESYTIDQKLQDREHDANWLFRRDPINRTKEIQELFQSFNNQVVTVLSKTDNQYIVYKLKKSLQRFKKKYHETFISYLSAKASQPSWAVTGRGNLNKSRYDKAMSRQDKLMLQLSELLEDIKKSISYYENKIRKDKESKIKQQVANTTLDITFTTETKEFIYMGMKEKKRVYAYNGYWVCKLWNCFRIFHKGKELKTTLKTTSKLEEAKQYVAFLVQQEAQKQAI